MKKLFVVLILTLFTTLSFAEVININENPFSVNVLSSSESETVIEYKFGSFEREALEIDGEIYYDLTLANEVNSYEEGSPSLPSITRSIIIPDDALMSVSIMESEFVEFNMQVLPSKGILNRKINPKDVPYQFSDTYETNAFYPETAAVLGEPYIMRDYRGLTVKAQPFVYNPQTQTLRVYTYLVLEVKATGVDTRNVKQRSSAKRNVYFSEIYRNHFINYFTSERYDTVEEQGRIVIISYGDYIDEMMPLVNWKLQKGIQCDIYDVADIGANASNISTFIEDEYDLNDGLTFVLLIGDAGEIPGKNGNQDPVYGCLEGNDFYPEVFISRFSAQTEAQVETQVERTLYYERDIVDGDWLHKGLGVASNQGSGDDNEYDDEHIDFIRDKLLDYTYTEVGQEYDSNGGSIGGAMNTLNAGTSIVNYCGHGSPTSWGNGAPMSVSNVNNLENDNMLPFIVSVACNNGQFPEYTCFAEAWLRATNSDTGLPTGAIAFYGSTISQSWDPPMRAEDHVNDLLVGWNYSTNEELEQKFTIGGLFFNGSCNMMDVYGTSGINEFKHWTIFGDASLLTRTDTPAVMNVVHQPTLFIGVNNFEVNTGVENALVCLSYENEILGSGYTDEAGNLNLDLQNVPTVPTDLLLTITGYNKVTYIEDIQLIPNDGPYMVVDSYLPDANGDDYIEAGETVYLQVSLYNLGAEAADNVNMSIFTDDTYITVTDDYEDFGLVESDETITIEDAFCFEVSEITPDLHEIQFTVLITSGENTWTSFIDLIAYEPNVFSVNPESFEVTLNRFETMEDVLSLINNSDRIINYTIRTQELFGGREITDSYVVCSTDEFTPGETVDWYFTVYNMSPDNEWLTDVDIEFPAGVTVNSATNFVGGSGGDLLYDETVGEAVSINWHGETALGYGLIHSAQAATAMVNVTTTTEFAGNIALAYTITGDGYGNDPHVIYGTMDIDYPLSWISLAYSSGTLQGSETHDIPVTFDAGEMEEGLYTCEIFISDVEDRDYMRVPVYLTVSTGVGADDDAIVNGNVHLGNYPNPFNPVTTISFSVSSDVKEAELDIYNIMGQKVKSYIVNTSGQQEMYSVVWDGTDDEGSTTASGIYFSKLKAGRFTSTKKMILMK
ncbi:C25 family cysteine peptidase [Candidatus Cloacimonadota bacterium]